MSQSWDTLAAGDVPILTQSEDWALSQAHVKSEFLGVPILTQSEDWAL